MPVSTRKVNPGDAPTLLAVRTATRENRFSSEMLASIGINAGSVASKLQDGTIAGWLSETPGGETIGFCLADLRTAELWVLAVLPGYEGRGVGRELLVRTERLLWAAGHAFAWLWTSTNRSLRAYHFYLAAGWVEVKEHAGQLYLHKSRPAKRRMIGR